MIRAMGSTSSLTLAIAVLLAGAAASGQEGQPFRLQPGDFRWVPFTVRQTPAAVDCHFEVLEGNPTVHVELMPMSEFRLFDGGRDHETLAVTPDGRDGDFRRIIDMSGRYAVVVVNEKRGRPVTVSLQVRTTVNPAASDVARMLSPERRLTVILISFGFFFVTMTWSARRLIRGMRQS